jgi:hypothetical protein
LGSNTQTFSYFPNSKSLHIHIIAILSCFLKNIKLFRSRLLTNIERYSSMFLRKQA